MCALGDYKFGVVEEHPASLHVHSTQSGEEIQVIRREDLGLWDDGTESFVYAVTFSKNSRALGIAAGSGTIHSLILY